MSADEVEIEEHIIGSGEVTLDVEELACRLAEAAMDLTRPHGKSAADLLITLERGCALNGIDCRFREQAHVAIRYLLEAMKAGQHGRLN